MTIVSISFWRTWPGPCGASHAEVKALTHCWHGGACPQGRPHPSRCRGQVHPHTPPLEVTALGMETSPEHSAGVKLPRGSPVAGTFQTPPKLLFARSLCVSHCLRRALVESSVGLTHPSGRRVLCSVGLTA